MARTRTVDTNNEYLGATQAFEIGQNPTAEDIQPELRMDRAESEAFMNEFVLIMVQSTGQPNEKMIVPVGVNGTMQYLRRDVPQRVRRKFVEALARAKKADYDQNIDHSRGEAMNTLIQRHSLSYPFSVIEDRNPKGGAWLRNILAQAN